MGEFNSSLEPSLDADQQTALVEYLLATDQGFRSTYYANVFLDLFAHDRFQQFLADNYVIHHAVHTDGEVLVTVNEVTAPDATGAPSKAALPFTDRFADAVRLAARLHARQTRKGTDRPYLAHLLAVSAIAIEHGADEDQAIAAVLHDAVEDQGGPPVLSMIRETFGDRVADLVDGCTDADEVPKPPWRPRKEAYLATLASADPSLILVSAADKLHNARSILSDHREIGEAVWARFTGGRDSLWYYRSLVKAYEAHELPEPVAALVRKLSRVVAELHERADEAAQSTTG